MDAVVSKPYGALTQTLAHHPPQQRGSGVHVLNHGNNANSGNALNSSRNALGDSNAASSDAMDSSNIVSASSMSNVGNGSTSSAGTVSSSPGNVSSSVGNGNDVINSAGNGNGVLSSAGTGVLNSAGNGNGSGSSVVQQAPVVVTGGVAVPGNARVPAKPFVLGLIMELLCFCVTHHTFRIKYYILRHNVVQKVLVLLHCRQQWLVLAAIRFLRTCIGLKDDFYHRCALFCFLFGVFFGGGGTCFSYCALFGCSSYCKIFVLAVWFWLLPRGKGLVLAVIQFMLTVRISALSTTFTTCARAFFRFVFLVVTVLHVLLSHEATLLFSARESESELQWQLWSSEVRLIDPSLSSLNRKSVHLFKVVHRASSETSAL